MPLNNLIFFPRLRFCRDFNALLVDTWQLGRNTGPELETQKLASVCSKEAEINFKIKWNTRERDTIINYLRQGRICDRRLFVRLTMC